jgi:hypothetical protein
MFNLDNEKENSINPIKGISVGEWLNPILEKNGISVTDIDDEDWGWYSYAKFNDRKYLIGYTAIPDQISSNDAEIIIQINKERSLTEILFGKNKLTDNDPIINIVSNNIKNTTEFKDIEGKYSA